MRKYKMCLGLSTNVELLTSAQIEQNPCYMQAIFRQKNFEL